MTFYTLIMASVAQSVGYIMIAYTELSSTATTLI